LIRGEIEGMREPRMTRDEVLQVLLKNLRANTEGNDGEIDPSRSMLDLGATSLDVVEIVSATIRELRLKIPRTRLAGLKNINELVDVLHQAAEERSSS
jgi:polyketide biosynthesis acyl carrier protein